MYSIRYLIVDDLTDENFYKESDGCMYIYGFLDITINDHSLEGEWPRDENDPGTFGPEDILLFFQQLQENVLTLNEKEGCSVLIVQFNLVDLYFYLENGELTVSERRITFSRELERIEWEEKIPFEEFKEKTRYYIDCFLKDIEAKNESLMDAEPIKKLYLNNRS